MSYLRVLKKTPSHMKYMYETVLTVIFWCSWFTQITKSNENFQNDIHVDPGNYQVFQKFCSVDNVVKAVHEVG